MGRYINNQKYSECQLVTAINAASYLGEPLVLPNTEEYERLVDYMDGSKDRGIFESSIRQAYKYLRIGYYRIPLNFRSVKRALELDHPVEVNFYNKPNLHSALIVDYNVDYVKVPNAGGITDRNGWVKWKNLYRLIMIGKKDYKKMNYDVEFNKLRAFYRREPRIVFEVED